MIHKTVLQRETIDLLEIKKSEIYLDLTLGSGGHSLAILNDLVDGTLICFDIDKLAISNFESYLKKQKAKLKKITIPTDKISDPYSKHYLYTEHKGNKIYLINDNFNKLDGYLSLLGIDKLDGIIADLGWSSDQLGNISGLSYENPEEELDMRFNSELGVKASDLLNALGKKELAKLFEKYGDIYGGENAKLVDEINKSRKVKLFLTVGDLLKVIDRSYKFNNNDRFKKNNKYKAYSRIFQSLRIGVNDEINNLKMMIESSFKNLNLNGKFLIITFHSGEEKIVKEFFQDLNKNNIVTFITGHFGELAIRPSVEELKENLRSRSAKLLGVKRLVI